MVSCHAVSASGPTPSGRPQRLVSTVPVDIEAAETNAATTPTTSRAPAARSTTRLTPNAATTPVSTLRAVGRCPSSTADSPTTISGPTDPTTAAIPPGSRYADRNSNGKKAPMFNAPSTAALTHHTPAAAPGRVRAAAARRAAHASSR